MPPYHPDYQAVTAVDDDDDELPLATLQTRSVRIRRGSEGFEVRPRHGASDSDEESQISDATHIEEDAGWEELYERKYSLYDSDSDD